MNTKPQKLVAGETMGKADREKEIREAIDRIFIDGIPGSVIILADTGRDIKVQGVGPIVDLRALLVNGVPQVVDMLDRAVESTPTRHNG